MHLRPLTAALLACALAACVGGDKGDSADTDTGASVEGCHAQPADAHRDRLALVSLPYGASGEQVPTWAAVTLSAIGELIDGGQRVQLGRSTSGPVHFTPDGQLAFTVHEDGSFGVLRVNEDLSVEVLQPSVTGEFYAGALSVHPSGEWLYVLDSNWVNNGGGLFRLPIDCDTGQVGDAERLMDSRGAAALVHTELERALLVAMEVPGGEDAFNVHHLDLSGPSYLGGASAFEGQDHTVTDAMLLGQHLVVSENSEWSGVPNRVATLSLSQGAPALVQTTEVRDPKRILASPHGDGVFVVSGYDDAVVLLSYDDTASEPLSVLGEPDYLGASPQLPQSAAVVTRGPLAGLVLVSENQGVRRMQLEPGPSLTDLDLTPLGDSFLGITGAIGIQP